MYQAVRANALAVHGRADAPDTAGGVDLADFAVARFLHGIGFVPAQKLDQQVIQEVRSRADEDVFRVNMHPTEGGQVTRNGLAQLRDSLVGQGQQQFFAVIQHDLPLEAGPDGKGELLGAVGSEIQQEFPFGFRFPGFRSGLGPGVAFHRFHKIAYLFLGADIALGQELVIGGFHGDLADFQILGQSALGGQLFTGPERAGKNVAADAAVERFV